MINKAIYVLAAIIAVTEAKERVVEEGRNPGSLVEIGNQDQRKIAVAVEED